MGARRDEEAAAGWPPWARRIVSGVLVVHLAALVAGVMGMPPASRLELAARELFSGYFNLLDLGQSYRFYSRLDRTVDPDDEERPWFTPVVTARLEFADGRVEEVRLPDPAQWPRLRYQRHMALAHWVFEEATAAARHGHESVRARSYARHLCAASGCERVTLYGQEHRIPPLDLVEQAAGGDPAAPRLDLDDPAYLTIPQRLGAYSCADL